MDNNQRVKTVIPCTNPNMCTEGAMVAYLVAGRWRRRFVVLSSGWDHIYSMLDWAGGLAGSKTLFLLSDWIAMALGFVETEISGLGRCHS